MVRKEHHMTHTESEHNHFDIWDSRDDCPACEEMTLEAEG